MAKQVVAIGNTGTQLVDKLANNFNELYLAKDNNGLVSIKEAGAVMDGVTDDSIAFFISLAFLGYAYVPEGTTVIGNASGIGIPTNARIFGVDKNKSIIKLSNSLAWPSPFASTADPVGGVRGTANITIRDLTFDGSARVPVTYPTALYNFPAPFLWLKGVDGYTIENCIFKGNPSYAVMDQGSRNAKILNCDFIGLGKTDAYSPALQISSWGNTAHIRSITNANPARVTVSERASIVSSSATSVYISGVRSMTGIPDGVYAISNRATVSDGEAFDLTGINTTSESPYVYEARAQVGHYNGNGTNYIPAEQPLVTGCVFRSNKFHGLSFMPMKGGVCSNNQFIDTGESAIYSEHLSSAIFQGNYVRGTVVRSIIGNAFEINYGDNIIVDGNIFEDTATSPLQIAACQNVNIVGNTFNRPIVDADVTFPDSPENPGGGGVIGSNSAIRLLALEEMGVSNVNITGNSVMDLRDEPQATEIVGFFRRNSSTGNINEIRVAGNVFGRSGVAQLDMIKNNAAGNVKAESLMIKDNLGHSSEAPVLLEFDVPGATGVVDYYVGFVPSAIHVMAFRVGSVANVSHTFIARDRTNIAAGTLGHGYNSGISGGLNVAARVNQDFYRIVNSSSVVQSQGEFNGWLCNSTGLGFSVNYTNVTSSARLAILVYP